MGGGGVLTPYLQTERATVWHAKAEEVYPHIDPGSVAMAWVDGPYAMKKAPWDMMNVDDLPAFYAPHYEALDRVLAPSATVYHWGTAEGLMRVDPMIRGMGWTFRVLITWDKGLQFLAGKGLSDLQTWPDVTEVCGFYQRQPSEVDLWNECGPTHPARLHLERARLEAGFSLDQIDQALGTSDMARHWFTWSQWVLPSVERFEQLRQILPGITESHASLSEMHRRLWEGHRARWDAIRAPFNPLERLTNVWPNLKVIAPERITLDDGTTHPCQKPLAFADRAIRASTRIGDTVIDPFSGTNRIALACHRLPPEEARHAHGIEMDRRWLDAIRHSLVADYGAVPKGQTPLFAGGR